MLRAHATTAQLAAVLFTLTSMSGVLAACGSNTTPESRRTGAVASADAAAANDTPDTYDFALTTLTPQQAAAPIGDDILAGAQRHLQQALAFTETADPDGGAAIWKGVVERLANARSRGGNLGDVRSSTIDAMMQALDDFAHPLASLLEARISRYVVFSLDHPVSIPAGSLSMQSAVCAKTRKASAAAAQKPAWAAARKILADAANNQPQLAVFKQSAAVNSVTAKSAGGAAIWKLVYACAQ